MHEQFDWKPLEVTIAALSALGTLAVVVLAIWGDWFRARFAPGKLLIETHDLAGDLTHFTQPNGAPLPPPNKVYFYHLKIVNKRPWISPKNCRVLLKAMSKRGPDNVFHSIPMSVPLQFVWAPAEITPTVVTIHHEQILDFGCVTEGDSKFGPRLYSQSNNFRGFPRWFAAAGEGNRTANASRIRPQNPHPVSELTPRLRMFAGPNGSGKSLLKSYLPKELLGIYLNPDEIEQEVRKQSFLDFATYGVTTTTDEVLSFFNGSSFLISAGFGDAAKAKADAMHLAVATSHRVDYLLTWNCKHLANAEILSRLRPVAEQHGYRMPEVCRPLQLMGEIEYEG